MGEIEGSKYTWEREQLKRMGRGKAGAENWERGKEGQREGCGERGKETEGGDKG